MKKIAVTPKMLTALAAFVKEKRKPLSQRKLSRKSGVSLRQIAGIEYKKLTGTTLSSRILIKLAQGLGVPTEELFNHIGATPPETEQAIEGNIFHSSRALTKAD